MAANDQAAWHEQQRLRKIEREAQEAERKRKWDALPELCDVCHTKKWTTVGGTRNVRVPDHSSSCKNAGDWCFQTVYSGGYYYGSGSKCGRPAKGLNYAGVPCCGVHLRHEREQARKETARRSAAEIQEWIKDETEAKAAQIREATGLEVRLEVRGWNGRGEWHMPTYTGKVIIDPSALIELFVEED